MATKLLSPRSLVLAFALVSALSAEILLLKLASAQSTQSPVPPLNPLPTNALEKCKFQKKCIGPAGTVHTGIDYPAKSGTRVRSICDGIIRFRKPPSTNIWNRFVVIEHNNCGGYNRLFAYYGHIDSKLPQGSKVRRGDVIGTVANWGNNSHLHFGLATKLFSSGWGYQSGNPEKNGWINPETFRYE